MLTSRGSFVLGAAAVSLCLTRAIALAAAEEPQITKLDTVVAVEGIHSNPALVLGRVVNQTDDQIEQVRLLVTDQFLWRNERHPGSESPAEAYVITVPGPIPPHDAATFTFERPSPLPERRDGEFSTEVSAVELTRRPVSASPGYPSEISVSPGRSSANTISR